MQGESRALGSRTSHCTGLAKPFKRFAAQHSGNDYTLWEDFKDMRSPLLVVCRGPRSPCQAKHCTFATVQTQPQAPRLRKKINKKKSALALYFPKPGSLPEVFLSISAFSTTLLIDSPKSNLEIYYAAASPLRSRVGLCRLSGINQCCHALGD